MDEATAHTSELFHSIKVCDGFASLNLSLHDLKRRNIMEKRFIMGLVFLFLVFAFSVDSIFEQVLGKEVGILEELREANTIDKMENIIEKYKHEKLDFLQKAVWKVEDMYIAEIRKNGPDKRFVFKGDFPKYEGKVAVECIEQMCFSSALINPDSSPGDIMIKELGGREPVSCVLRFAGKVHSSKLPYYSYNRKYIGEKEVNYYFVSDEKFPNQLTFAYIRDVGYVYLRGVGKLILPSGKEVEFGYTK